jgi:hypothetical protein
VRRRNTGRRHHITDNLKAQECVQIIVGWIPNVPLVPRKVMKLRFQAKLTRAATGPCTVSVLQAMLPMADTVRFCHCQTTEESAR